ncbi:MAG TPA: DUF302 domain-containing protein [Gammaproteobacteria bacterium]|nr:DUF302 domain-containing protein [Gammaproteobacteria bacterium]
MKHLIIILIGIMFVTQAAAEGGKVRVWNINKDLDSAYKVVYESLENNRFFVVFEPDIQANLSNFAERWGDDYNRNKLEGIRAMVFCNGWYANAVSNADPEMLALCPLHITLIQKDGATRVLFVRPTAVAEGSKAMSVAKDLEAGVAKALDEAVAELSH